ncbi:hypothetical protein H310_11718 [Aphanomyces invadans]|uniref:Uncharacterized protein n=1 Tax=Aphanomyces invadans TaxID=157072 RepID=A0A024TN20_9STRA|nr:hypothetical protein H310_11718 [Aphanomyces invadans]ETV94757.1 hypothetical protein H310_11718 [Aphanomyces invadans]|eukprot:XP_008876702.1 hypothetical protein H310_11718 [Aphanomyces invadans]
MAARCFFAGCENGCADGSVKCAFHLHRRLCAIEGCRSQVYARGFCVKHGGKLQCQFEGCVLNSRIGTFCTKHGPPEHIRHCSEPGCTNQAHLGGRCFRHGGRRVCSVDGCKTLARMRGLCTRHMTKKEKMAQEFKCDGLDSPQTPRAKSAAPSTSALRSHPVAHTAPHQPPRNPPQVKNEPHCPDPVFFAHRLHPQPPLAFPSWQALRSPPKLTLPPMQLPSRFDGYRHAPALPPLRQLPVYAALRRPRDAYRPQVILDHRHSKSQALAEVATLLADYYQ